MAVRTRSAAEPQKGKGTFTLYYITQVKPVASGGSTGKVQTVEGQWKSYRLEATDNKKANIQGTGSGQSDPGISLYHN